MNQSVDMTQANDIQDLLEAKKFGKDAREVLILASRESDGVFPFAGQHDTKKFRTAIRSLERRGFVTVSDNEIVKITQAGRDVASKGL